MTVEDNLLVFFIVLTLAALVVSLIFLSHEPVHRNVGALILCGGLSLVSTLQLNVAFKQFWPGEIHFLYGLIEMYLAWTWISFVYLISWIYAPLNIKTFKSATLLMWSYFALIILVAVIFLDLDVFGYSVHAVE